MTRSMLWVLPRTVRATFSREGFAAVCIYKWFHEERDPTAETVADVVEALNDLNREVAEEFVQLYLGNITKGDKNQ